MPTRRVIRDAILAGIETANVRYEKWSRGWWLNDSGVEGLAVAAIAEKLHPEMGEHGSLAMELPFSYIHESSGAQRPPGRPPTALRGPAPCGSRAIQLAELSDLRS